MTRWLEAILASTLIEGSRGLWWNNNSSTTEYIFVSTTDNFYETLSFSLNWLTVPFFLFIMVLGIGFWYRRYKIRQHFLSEQRLNNPACVRYNGSVIGVTIPPNDNSASTLPPSAYPRQPTQPANHNTGLQPEFSCPPYQAEPPADETNLPPCYEDAIKQPVQN